MDSSFIEWNGAPASLMEERTSPLNAFSRGERTLLPYKMRVESDQLRRVRLREEASNHVSIH